MMWKSIVAFFTLSYCVITLAASPSLEDINQQITQVQKALSNTQLQQTQQVALLRKSDITIGQLSQVQRQTRTQLRRKRRAVTTLSRTVKTTQSNLNEQQDLLGQQLRAHYQLGKNTTLKLLLNQTEPSKTQRLLAYLKQVNQSRAQLLQTIKGRLTQLNTQQQQLARQQKDLQRLYQRQRQERRQLQSAQRNQQRLVTQLRQQLQSQRSQLSTLQMDKARLENVLQQLPQHAFPTGKTPFAQLRGKLPWPTRGQLLQRFGTQIAQSQLTATGILIAAPETRAVRAIYPGRVVFADWLKGYGLLLIIDHGAGYMSLYGHNYSLYKKLGDTVSAGDILAQVGHSGGYVKNGLYFEIRQQGQAKNPLTWLAANEQ